MFKQVSRKPLTLNFAPSIAISDIPAHVVSCYLRDKPDCPIQTPIGVIASDAEKNQFYSELDKYSLIDLVKRIKQSSEGGDNSSGYLRTANAFQSQYMMPEVYNHEKAYQAILNIVPYGNQAAISETLDRLMLIQKEHGHEYSGLVAKEDPTPVELSRMNEIDNARQPVEDIPPVVDVGHLCRAIPVVQDEQQSRMYRMAQSVLELPFAFVRVVKEGEVISCKTPSTPTYREGLKLVYGLEPSFAYNINAFMKNLIGSIPKASLPELTNNHYDNAIRLMAFIAADRQDCIRTASYLSAILYVSVGEGRQKKCFVRVPDLKEEGNLFPVMWNRSFRPPQPPDVVLKSFRSYTKFTLLLQELRGKSDRFSNKLYRLPVGDATAQVHLENAIRLQRYSGSPVLIVDRDTNSLIKMGWGIILHGIKGIYINMSNPGGKEGPMSAICRHPHKDYINFSTQLSTISSPQQSKQTSEEVLFAGVYRAHYDAFAPMQIGTAAVVKSHYFPHFNGIKYYESSEPHNGSVIVHKVSEIVLEEPKYEEMWKDSQNELKRCLHYALCKTMFTLCRERVQLLVDYRAPLRVETVKVSINDFLLNADEGGQSEMATMTDDYFDNKPLGVSSNKSPPPSFSLGGKGAPSPAPLLGAIIPPVILEGLNAVVTTTTTATFVGPTTTTSSSAFSFTTMSASPGQIPDVPFRRLRAPPKAPVPVESQELVPEKTDLGDIPAMSSND
jgi:hypothetical protein